MGTTLPPAGPDLSLGVELSEIGPGVTIAGRVGEERVLLSRIDDELFAVGGSCSHYGAALGDGLVDGETVRCPLHHACFSLRTGAVLRAPAFDGLERWRVEIAGGHAFVREKLAPAPAMRLVAPTDVRSILIVGGGAAGFACAERLRALGFDGRVTMASADRDVPCDRPNLSKDFLAGSAPADWIPLRGPDWYRDMGIDLRLDTEIVAIDPVARIATSRGGEAFAFDRLLLATGSEPIRLPAPGLDRGNVHVLRSLADAQAIAERAKDGARAAIIGSSFIGLEAAAALRTRGIEVDVISLDRVPFERVLGEEIGLFFQHLHARNGVRFHLGRTVSSFDGRTLLLDDGSAIEADFVILGVGVRPRTQLAASAGLGDADGIRVDAWLETEAAGIFAAGDVAACPDPISGDPVRIEHWVVAQRQGQAAASNMLGLSTRFDAAPFFWTGQYGVSLRFVGHAPRWDEVRIDGDVAEGDFTARYFEGGRLCAAASVGRDRENLEAELRLETLAESIENACPELRTCQPAI